MNTIPFHWDTLDAPQCPRMACLCPDECHEGRGLSYLILNNLFCRIWTSWHVLVQNPALLPVFLHKLAFIIDFPAVRFCDMLLHVWSCGVFACYINDGTAAGINREATEKGPHNLRI